MYAQDVEDALQDAILRACGSNAPKKAATLLVSQELTTAMADLVRRLNQAGRSSDVTPALGIYTIARLEKARTCGELNRLIRYLIDQANSFRA